MGFQGRLQISHVGNQAIDLKTETRTIKSYNTSQRWSAFHVFQVWIFWSNRDIKRHKSFAVAVVESWDWNKTYINTSVVFISSNGVWWTHNIFQTFQISSALIIVCVYVRSKLCTHHCLSVNVFRRDMHGGASALTMRKQLRTLGSTLLPPKAATSPNWRGIWMASWSSRLRWRWSVKPPGPDTWRNKSATTRKYIKLCVSNTSVFRLFLDNEPPIPGNRFTKPSCVE